MEIIETKIKDLLIIKPDVFLDERGYFFESYNKQRFLEHGLDMNFVQDNESQSMYGVLRGLHFQRPPFTQGKLVRVVKGAVMDVAVDLRKGSPTYGNGYRRNSPKATSSCFGSPKVSPMVSYAWKTARSSLTNAPTSITKIPREACGGTTPT